MIRVNYDKETNKVLGFYPEEVDYINIPEPAILISKAQWQKAIDLQSSGKELYVENNDIIGKEYVYIPTQDELYNKELEELENWFVWYDRQVQEYSRCQRLGIKYENSQNLTISQLDKLAESNKTRINELRSILNVKD